MSVAADAAVAAHRFGLGEPDLALVGTDARAWLKAQIGPAEPRHGDALPAIADALQLQAQARRRAGDPTVDAYRDLVAAEVRARLATAATTTRPFAERLALFWSNHFAVSNGKGASRGLVGAFEREAIRPHIAGRFADLLAAATTHPAMLRYLDNTLSAGPQSPVVEFLQRRARQRPDARPPRLTGLNENLARELLELHTLGVAGGGGPYGPWGGYTQADVTALAAVLTGWRGAMPDRQPGASAPDDDGFDPRWHQPGDKLVLGRRYPEGKKALRALLDDLARQPSTARFIATKLARQFVDDAPPPALVERLARTFSTSDGHLPTVYAALIDAPEAWDPAPAKLRTPEEFALASARLLRLGERIVQRAPDAGISTLGQRVQNPPSPAGWPDRADDWIGPEAVWQRVEWAGRIAQRVGPAVDARALAVASLGPRLAGSTQREIERASDGPQALALLLLAPEFQRR